MGKAQMRHVSIFIENILNDDKESQVSSSLKNYKKKIFLYCSLLERSIQSGEIVANILDLPLYANLDVHENGGMFDYYEETDERVGRSGPTKSEIIRNHPNLVLPSTMKEGSWWDKPYEGQQDSIKRAHKAIKNLLNTHPGEDEIVIWIGHEDFYNTFLKVLLEIQRKDIWCKLNNGAVTLIEFLPKNLIIHFENYYGFLPFELVD